MIKDFEDYANNGYLAMGILIAGMLYFIFCVLCINFIECCCGDKKKDTTEVEKLEDGFG